MKKVWTPYFLLLVVCSCSFNKQTLTSGGVFENRENETDYTLLYFDESLDFSVSYWGYTKYIVAPRKKIKDGYRHRMQKYSNQKCLVYYKRKSDNPPRKFIVYRQKTSDLNKSRDALCQFLRHQNKEINIDTIPRDTSMQHEHREIRYILNSKSSFICVVEYHLKIKDTICRFVFTEDLNKKTVQKEYNDRYKKLLNDDAQRIMKTYKTGVKEQLYQDYLLNPHSMATNVFIDSKYNYMEPIFWLNYFSSKDTLPTKDVSLDFALRTFNTFMGKFTSETPEADSSVIFPSNKDRYIESNAADEIIKLSGTKKVIMLNEDHLNPYGRIFAKGLLQSLYNNGYRYMAVEALTYDSQLNERDHVLKSSGFYVSEPSFGDLLREALKLGFLLVPYENDQPCECADVYCRINCRDSMQALNIADIFKQDPNAKVFVYAGHGHVYKKSTNLKVKYMAERFAALTGITPFCIDQVEWNDQMYALKSSSDNENIKNIFNAKNSSVLKNPDNVYWVTPKRKSAVDMQIVHPHGTTEKAPPDWLLNKGENGLDLKLKGKKYKGSLLQVLYKSEVIKSHVNVIPLINIGLKENNDIHFSLPNDTFYIQIINRNDVKYYLKEINLKQSKAVKL